MKYIKDIKKFLVIFCCLFFTSLFSSNNTIDLHQPSVINLEHSENFAKLIIQDNGGRLKPVSTLCSEFIRKIYGKDRINNQSAVQVVLSMMNDPILWSDAEIIKVSNIELRKLLDIKDLSSKYIRTSFNELYRDGNYLLANYISTAYSKQAKDRTQFDKEVIKVDERVNLCFLIFSADVFRLFPVPGDQNETWLAHSRQGEFEYKDSLFITNIIPMYFMSIRSAIKDQDWTTSDTVVSYIKRYQMKYGENVYPSDYKIDLEIIYNKYNIFSRLFIYYSLCGVVLLVLLLIQIFKKFNFLRLFIKFSNYLIYLGFIIHSIGLTIRWIISGHAPWSNGYESMIYIAWATILAGILFSKRSSFTLAATSIASGLLLMVAHLNWLDPSITNLVPVLDSYWLMIHVAIITASYGFVLLGSVLGLLSLWLIVFANKNNKNRISIILSELTFINEKTLQVGLFMLTTGTFLGGIWANESWGRYWGWDPKETWALVSILIYTFVLHMRFIPSLKGILIFNISAMFAIWTIIMTYFGVNYYLSGLHSYAAGDPMPIPVFVYYLFALMIITSFLSIFNFKKLNTWK